MYTPRHFAMTDEHVRSLLATAETAQLVTAHETGPVATLLPLTWRPDAAGEGLGSLVFHVTRVNPVWKEPHLGEALAILSGPDGYIDADWYASNAEAPGVPTWNYVTVQAKGTLVAHDDPDWTLQVVRRLCAAHDDDALTTMTPDAIQRLLRAIVGVELRGVALTGKAKMSQNKPPEVIEQVIDGLRESGGDETAEWMAEVSLPRAEAKAAKLAAIRSGQRRSLD